MQRMKNWEVEMPHGAFMAEIRRMSSGTYAAGRVWSEALQDRKERSATSDEVFAGNGGRAGRPRKLIMTGHHAPVGTGQPKVHGVHND